MEAMLLGFCLSSLTLSSVFVMVELARDRRKQKGNHHRGQVSQKPLSVLQKKAQAPLGQSAPTPVEAPLQVEKEVAPKKSKVLDSLNKQLKSLGYVSKPQQLGFINRVLNSQCQELDDIDPNEIRQLFKVIRRYSNQESKTPTVPISPSAALPQTAAISRV